MNANKIIIKLLLCIIGHQRFQLKLKEREMGVKLEMVNIVDEAATMEEAKNFVDNG